MVNEDWSLENPIPFHLCNRTVHVILLNISIRQKEEREFIVSLSSNLLDMTCQTTLYMRETHKHRKKVSFFQYLEIALFEIHCYVSLASQPCFFPTGHHTDLQQSEYLPIYCGKNKKNIRNKLRRLHNKKNFICGYYYYWSLWPEGNRPLPVQSFSPKNCWENGS